MWSALHSTALLVQYIDQSQTLHRKICWTIHRVSLGTDLCTVTLQ